MAAHPGDQGGPSRRRGGELTPGPEADHPEAGAEADTDPDTDPAAEAALAETGDALARAVPPAVAAWVVRSVRTLLDAWEDSVRQGASAAARPALLAAVADARTTATLAADRAAERAATDVGGRLSALLGADVDAQQQTPLQVVRAAAVYPTAVLREAGVPAVVRDRFAEERFPEDPYGLTPASLAAVDPALGDLAIAWGAAKARAHRRRHQSGG